MFSWTGEHCGVWGLIYNEEIVSANSEVEGLFLESGVKELLCFSNCEHELGKGDSLQRIDRPFLWSGPAKKKAAEPVWFFPPHPSQTYFFSVPALTNEHILAVLPLLSPTQAYLTLDPPKSSSRP